METKEQILIRRVFNLIAQSHFTDMKSSKEYTNRIIFPRNLGEDIARYMQKYFPLVYKHRSQEALRKKSLREGTTCV